jgi:hypothetical protein
MSSKVASSERTFHQRPLASLCCQAYVESWRKPEANPKSPKLSKVILDPDSQRPKSVPNRKTWFANEQPSYAGRRLQCIPGLCRFQWLDQFLIYKEQGAMKLFRAQSQKSRLWGLTRYVYSCLEMPSFFILECSVVRLSASRPAAPLAPPTIPLASRSACKMCSLSASSMV